MSGENLNEQIRKQIEFYFGDANLSRDSFLKEKIAENRDCYVSIDCLLTFKKLASLTTEPDIVSAALRESSFLELDPEGLSVRRVEKFDDSIDFTANTVIIYPVPGEGTEQQVRLAVSKFHPESKICAIWRKRRKHPVTKLSMNVAEIHWNDSADVASFLKLSDHGKKIEFQDQSDLNETEFVAVSKSSFEELFSKNPEKTHLESKETGISLNDINKKVLDLVADSPIGAVKYVKNIVTEDIRSAIKYVHVIEGDFNRMLVLFETTDACEKALVQYDGAKPDKSSSVDGAKSDKPSSVDGDEQEKKTSKIKASLVDDETVLNTVLIGYKERMKTFNSGKRNFGNHKRHRNNDFNKKKWRKR